MAGRSGLIYLTGPGRSGSTMVARLLREQGFVYDVGEACRFLYNARMRGRGFPCSCGKEVHDCEFWAPFVRTIDPRLVQLATNKLRMKNVLWIRAYSNSLVGDEGLDLIRGEFDRLITFVRTELGSGDIMDTSKSPTHGFVLAKLFPQALRVLHMVRDPRAVVSSWLRPKLYIPRRSLLQGVVEWNGFNIGSELLKRRCTHSMTVKYENVVQDPKSELLRISSELGISAVTEEGQRNMKSFNHVLAGNPDKLDATPKNISERSWSLTSGQRAAVNIATLPLNLKYGYSLWL